MSANSYKKRQYLPCKETEETRQWIAELPEETQLWITRAPLALDCPLPNGSHVLLSFAEVLRRGLMTEAEWEVYSAASQKTGA